MTIVIRLIMAALILGTPFILGHQIRRYYQLDGNWVTAGIIIFMGAFISQTVILLAIPIIFLNNPLIGGVLVGLIIGLTDTIARVIGYQTIASEAVYRGHAYLLGLGSVFLPLIFSGVSLLFDMASHIHQGTTGSMDSSVALAELITSWASLLWYLSLSWIMLQSFIRGQLGWIFGALLWSSVVAGTQAFVLNGSLNPITVNSIWWVIVALISVGLLYLVKAPTQFRWPPSNNASE